MRRTVLCLVGALLLAGCASPSGGEPPAGGSDAAAPDAPWTFRATDGSTHTPGSPPSNATVLFFMATWCGTCRTKAPLLAEAQDELAGQGVRFLSIGFDPSEPADDLAAWQARYGQDWPHGLDEDRQLQRAFRVTIQSTVIVLDADGREVERFGYGKVTPEALRAAVDRALAA